MSKVTIEQSHAVMAILAQNIKWDKLDMKVIQESVIQNPIGAGAEFTLFLQNGCCASIGDMKITVKPFSPVKYLGFGWKIIVDEHDERNDCLIEVDFNKVDFVTCLKENETSITGEEKLKRLKESKQIRYGATTFMGLWNDYQTRKGNSVLETLFRTKNITHLDFFGDVLLRPDGGRLVLSLCRDCDGQWRWSYGWLDHDWIVTRLSVVSSQVSA
jgi:hypothetical protein